MISLEELKTKMGYTDFFLEIITRVSLPVRTY